MRQSKWMSAGEVTSNQVLGFMISVAVMVLIGPYVGWTGTIASASGLTILLTGLSILRSYGLRRLFDWFDYQKESKDD